ncbi:ABC transporter ATP-binding protein [Ectothiorhodospiraceae bacterium BW-2]|nr:ABC transporter ATP-binding protein [Ectothiorhodospiraceae bacterium BW-2]
MSDVIALEVRELIKCYGSHTAVDGIDLAVPEGSCFGLLGPNGAGKSTTMEMMEGMIEPTAGEIFYRGKPRDHTFRFKAGIQFQHTALQEFLSVKETLQLFSGLYPDPLPLPQLIELCSLQSFLYQDNRHISGGQRQRLLLALALVGRPEILFLDEPTTGLDPQSRRHFWQLLRHIQQQQTTIILSTHYMEEASELCDQVAIIDHGKVIALGTPRALLKEHFEGQIVQLPQSDFVANWEGSELITEQQGWVELTTTDVGQTLTRLLHRGVDLSRVQVRQRNLEDLFLHITGKELRQ